MTTADRRVEAAAKAMYDDAGSSLTDARLFTWEAATEAVRADWRPLPAPPTIIRGDGA